jgi:aspartyl protease family protein
MAVMDPLKPLILLALIASVPCVIALEKIVVLGLFKDKAIVEIDGRKRSLTAGAMSPEGVRLIAANSSEALIEVNGKRGTYTLGTHIGSAYASVSPQATVQIWPDATGMYTVEGNINQFPIKFLVDTGASTVAMNKHQAKRLGLDYKLNSVEGKASTASGIARAYYLTLKKVRVGEIELKEVPAVVIDGDFPLVSLLGMSFLNRVDMMRNGRMLELRKK